LVLNWQLLDTLVNTKTLKNLTTLKKKFKHIKEMGGIGKPIPPKPLLRQNDATFMGIS
jgi:hypothetical protein